MSIAVVWSSANTDGLTASAKDAFELEHTTAMAIPSIGKAHA